MDNSTPFKREKGEMAYPFVIRENIFHEALKRPSIHVTRHVPDTWDPKHILVGSDAQE